MKIAIGIATAGRRDGLSETVDYLRRQTRMADTLYICPAGEDDLDTACLDGFPCPTQVLRGPRGLPAQRNAILRALGDEDIVLFIDDDYLPAPDFLKELDSLFTATPGLVMATGYVAADGINTRGITFADGARLIDTLPAQSDQAIFDVYNAYGCNMAAHVPTARQHKIEFDENLPLYGWWEDVDFSRRMAPFGRIVNSPRLRGVHLGSKKGRSPGKRLGYSQVANILYLARKGSIGPKVAFVRIARNVVANIIRTLAPEPWVDRRGRLAGNFMALGDAAMGRVDPGKILKL
jgi:hypothetical protein